MITYSSKNKNFENENFNKQVKKLKENSQALKSDFDNIINKIYFADDNGEENPDDDGGGDDNGGGGDDNGEGGKENDGKNPDDSNNENNPNCVVTNSCVDGADGISKHTIIDFNPEDFIIDIGDDFAANHVNDFTTDFTNPESPISTSPINDLVNDAQSIIKQYKDWNENQLTYEEKKALTDFTVSDYEGINTYLRDLKGELSEVPINNYSRYDVKSYNRKIGFLDSALNKASVENTMIVYRLVNEQQFGLAEGSLLINNGTNGVFNESVLNEIISKNTGQLFNQHAFMSTSISRHILTPNSNFGYTKFPIFLKFTLPKGTRAGFLGDSISSFQNSELEILVKRGVQWKYESFEPKEMNGRKYLEVTLSFVKKLK